MDASRIAGRIRDNLAWAAAFGRTGGGVSDDVWSHVRRAWREPDEAFVAHLYLALLGRPADPAGLNVLCAALAAGAHRATVVRQLALSAEARCRALDVSWLPRLAAQEGPDIWRRVQALWGAADRPFVEGIYLALLGRPADAPGRKAFCAALASGLPRAHMVRLLALSEEARSNGLDFTWLPRLAVLDTADLWQSVHALWGAADRPFVEGLYLALLGRPADAPGRKAFCAALASGLPRAEVVRRVALSEEAQSGGLDVSWLPHLDALPLGRAVRRSRLSFASFPSLIRRWLGPRRAPNRRPAPPAVRPRPAAAAVAAEQAA